MAETNTIHQITHPDYDSNITNWLKYRLTYDGGDKFKEKYLRMFSKREDITEFLTRRNISYVPAHAASAVDDVKNAIFQRMSDIARSGGPDSYQLAITGQNGGVDLTGNSMDGFISRIALPELLIMSKVGIYIDKPVKENTTKAKDKTDRPYIYIYRAEDIRSWHFNSNNELIAVLLRDCNDEIDTVTGLVVGTIERFRLLQKIDNGVKVTFYTDLGEEEESQVLPLPKIPFVLMDISKSLMNNIADYQIGLLNICSSDMNYITQANFPFYTEQMDLVSALPTLRKASPIVSTESETNSVEGGTAESAGIAKDNEIKVGVTKGRRYLKGLERPGFINPSSEPLKASMDKQEQMKQEIRQLVNLNLTNIEPRRASAEAKSYDERGLESGLSFIGMELEYGERFIAEIWALYENLTNPSKVSVHYPRKYNLRTDEEINKEANDLLNQAAKVPSTTYQKETIKRVIDITMGLKVTDETLKKMKEEIDKSKFVVIDREVLTQDLENGLVSAETASPACGYPEGEVPKAQEERATRAAAVALAQSEAAARGVADMDPDPAKSAKNEKENNNLQEE